MVKPVQSPLQLYNSIISFTTTVRDSNISSIISLFVLRNDDLNETVEMVNSYITNICENIGFQYIRRENHQRNIYLNASKLHLNKKDYAIFLSRYLNSVNWRFHIE